MGAESNGYKPVEIINGTEDPDIKRWRADKLIPVTECERRDAGQGVMYWVTRYERIGDIVLRYGMGSADEPDKAEKATEVSLV